MKFPMLGKPSEVKKRRRALIADVAAAEHSLAHPSEMVQDGRAIMRYDDATAKVLRGEKPIWARGTFIWRPDTHSHKSASYTVFRVRGATVRLKCEAYGHVLTTWFTVRGLIADGFGVVHRDGSPPVDLPRRAARVAAKTRGDGKARTALPKPVLTPGMELTGTRKGKTYTVKVVDGGQIEYRGGRGKQLFPSLNQAANAILGVKSINALAFFGLRMP